MAYRYTLMTWRNVAMSPLVIPLRILIMLPLGLLRVLGDLAEKAGDFMGDILPAFEKKRVQVKLKPGETEPRLLTKAERAALAASGRETGE